MKVYDLPLQELFTRLCRASLPLGIDDYQILLYSLQAGFGISDCATLKRLCQTLWAKSADDSRLLDYHFEQVLSELAKRETAPALLESSPDQAETFPETPSPLSSAEPTFPETPSSTASETTTTSEVIVGPEDEVRVAQAVLHAANIDDDMSLRSYISSDEYFPVTRRQMKQSWRYLRRLIREGPPAEVDIGATVDEVGQKGILLEPILVPRRINRSELLLLVDHGGSMVPFHIISRRLIETALRGGRLGKSGVYYFHNCPMEYLCRDPAFQEYEQIDEILKCFSQRTGIMVFSDAGAARGGFSSDRLDMAEKFLKRFKQQFRYIVWLNPMPRFRWPGTTAGEVMKAVPMFDLSRRGLDDAISVLRGHSAPPLYVHIEEQRS